MSPVSHRDHLSLFADNDDEFNSQSEDNQVLAPDTEIQNVLEIQSDVSTDDMRFQNLVEEVLRLLPADMFPKKTVKVLGGNRPRSSIELEMQKATKKSISMPQSRRPLIKAVDCLKESLGASEVDGSLPMPSTITQYWVPSRADIKKLVQLNNIKLIMNLFQRRLHRSWTLTQIAWICLSRVLILLRCQHSRTKRLILEI